MDCPFCGGPSIRLDNFPVTEGHTLVVSRRHVSSICDLSLDEQEEMLLTATSIAQYFRDLEGLDCNIGINIGEAAGQTVPHAHIHVIPRRPGDHPNPRGGVRAVIPGRADY